MHKAQNMSQRRITLPVTLEFRAYPANLVAVSRNAYLRDPDSAPRRYIRKEYRELDPWDLRDMFLAWLPEDWKNFLSFAGSFSTSGLDQGEFMEWQGLLREALKLPPRKWPQLQKRFDPRKVEKFLAPLRIEFVWDEESPRAHIATMRSLDAIIATIQLDKLRGTQFRTCARHDCAAPPFPGDDPRKQFCSAECAHLVAVRRSRARAPKTGKRKDRRGKP
jgi:hypothetical protein